MSSPETNGSLTQLVDALGQNNPFRRWYSSARPEEGQLDVNTLFYGLENPPGGLPGPAPEGPPYTVKDGAFHVVKQAAHAHDRMEERTPFHRSYADDIQMVVDTLDLKGQEYHLPLRSRGGKVEGYAVFGKVPNRGRPVLKTVLAPHMKPSGQNIEAMLRKSAALETNDSPRASGQFDTDHIDPRPPESSAWNRRHSHGFAPEQASYAFRRAFDGVTTKPKYEVIESAEAPSQTPDMMT